MALSTVASTSTIRAQLVAEATPGTIPGSPAYIRLPSLTLIGGPSVEETDYRGQGYKAATLAVLNKDWTAFSVDGPPTFDELTYILSSALQLVSPTMSDTSAYTWVMAPSVSNPDAAKTYTIQWGNDSRGGWQSSFAVFDGFTLSLSRKENKLAATGFGQAWTDIGPSGGSTPKITALASVTEIPKIPLLPSNTNIFLDTTWGGIGTTALSHDFTAELSLSGRWHPVWALNSSGLSYSAVAEGVPTLGLKVQMEANSASDALMTQFRDTTTAYMRLQVTSPVLAGAASALYNCNIDVPVQVKKADKQADMDGVWTAPWEFLPVSDPTAGTFIQVSLVNKLASL